MPNLSVILFYILKAQNSRNVLEDFNNLQNIVME